MVEYEMTLMDRQRIAKEIMAFWFETDGAHYEFQAGQHADLAFLHPIILEGDNSRTFSIANSPRDRNLVMIAMRMRETPFEVALNTAGLGTKFKVHWATQERLSHKLYLFYSNRSLEDAAFLEDLEGLATQNRSFTLIPTITHSKRSRWPYENGPIDRNLLRRYLYGLNGLVYYVAGPAGMVAAMTALLQSSGVSDDDIKTEESGDYKQDPLPKS